jgi:MFS family permease
MTSFLVTFDITAVVVAMPRIKEDLHLDVAGFAWVMDAYSLAFTVMLMAAGVLADRYGRRKALLFGNLVFALASLACGMAWSDVSLWAARAVQGLGAAFVICGGLSMMSDHYREQQQRVKAFALAGTVTGAAMALGPSGGGLVADLVGWRWVFLLNIPVCLLIAIVLPRVTHESRDSTARRIDLAGVATLTLSLLSLIWLLLHGRVVGGVEVPPLIAVSAVLACFGAFIATQKLQKTPMIDLSLFANRSFLGICLVPLALSIAYWSLLVYLPLFLQQGLGQPLDRTSLLMLAATLPMLLLPFAGARIAARLQSRGFFSLGLGVVSAGVAVTAGAAATGSLPLALVGMTMSGAGTAVLNAQVSGAIVSMAPRDRAGTVSAIATILRQGGFAAGIAVLGALLTAQQASPSSFPGASQPFVLPFVVASACSLVAALLVLALVRPPQAAAKT